MRKPTHQIRPANEAARYLMRNMASMSAAEQDRIPVLGIGSLMLRVAGIEARVKAEARIANDRLSKIEARLDRIASALRRLIARDGTPPADSENE